MKSQIKMIMNLGDILWLKSAWVFGKPYFIKYVFN